MSSTIKTALILAAGNGSRLVTVSEGKPKPLVELNGRPLIEHILLGAREAGIERFVVVAGFRADAIRSWAERQRLDGTQIEVVENPQYKTKANGISVLQARHLIAEPFLLLMADHVFEPETAAALLRQRVGPGEAILAVDTKLDSIFDMDDATKVRRKGPYIIDIGKQLSQYDAVDTGMFLCTPGVSGVGAGNRERRLFAFGWNAPAVPRAQVPCLRYRRRAPGRMWIRPRRLPMQNSCLRGRTTSTEHRWMSLMSKSSSNRRPLRVLAALMGIALLVSLIIRTGAGTVIEHAKAVGWGMVLIVALGGISHLLRTCAWRLSFRSDLRGISLARLFALRLISEATGNFGLAGQVIGDSMRISLLGPAIPIADRISSVAFDRGIYIVSAALLSVSAMLTCVSLLPLPGAWRLYALLFAAAMAGVVGLALVGFGRQWRLASVAARGIQRLPLAKKWLAGKVAVIESAEENLLSFRSQAPRSFWTAIFLYIGSQVLAITEVYLLLRFMGVRIAAAGALVIEGFTKLISVVGAVNPGNIGTYEGGNLVLAHLLGFSAGAGLTLALCRRARALFWAGVGALCLIFSRGREQSQHEPVDEMRSGKAPESQAVGASETGELGRGNALAVIIAVENQENSGAFMPALARVGALPVLLRAILSAQQMLRPSRIVVSLSSSPARVVKEELRRTGRLPQSMEWRDQGLGTDCAPSCGTSQPRQIALCCSRELRSTNRRCCRRSVTGKIRVTPSST